HAMGYRYRLHAADLPGKPDIVFRKTKVAIFVHGCFWHQHQHPSCKLAVLPKSRIDFWKSKLEGNRARDERRALELKALGWEVFTVWECELASPARVREDLRLVLMSRQVQVDGR